MHRIDGAGFAPGNLFTEGNPATALPATAVTADWLNDLQEELMSILTAAAVAPVKGNRVQLLAALRSAGVFSTPPQFDASTKAATMEAVQRALGSLRSETAVNSSTTLGAAAVGQLIVGSSASAFTTTLPLASSCAAGSQVHFQATSPISTWLIQRQGTDIIDNNGGATFLALGLGDTATFESNGAGTWRLVGGSAALRKCADFGASLPTGNGFQKLPSGKVEQWGNSGAIPAGSQVTITLPIAMPNALHRVVATCETSTSDTTPISAGWSALSQSQFVLRNKSSVAAIFSWQAIGY